MTNEIRLVSTKIQSTNIK